MFLGCGEGYAGKDCAGQPARAAVFFLARNATMDRLVEAIRPYNPTVLSTGLRGDTERELIELLQHNHPVGATKPNS